MKKIVSSVLVCLLVLSLVLTGCSNSNSSTPEVTAPDWETKTETSNGFSYEVPADWVITDDPTGSGGIIYIPPTADVNLGTSNVNILMQQSGSPAVTLKDMNDSFSSAFKDQLISQGAEKVENIKTSSLTNSMGDVFVISYDLTMGGMNFKQVQYYPLVDDYIVVITSTEIDDGVEPAVKDVAEYMAQTFKK